MGGMIGIVSAVLGLVKQGKQTVDDIMNDPAAQQAASEAESQFRAQAELEFTHGDSFTRRARPLLIYIAAAALANDLLIYPYVHLWWPDQAVTILTESKFGQLMAMLSALGLARSVFDKQGPWLRRLIGGKLGDK